MNILQLRYIIFYSKPNNRIAKFMYSPLGNSLENQTKTIKEQIEKQIKTNEKSNALIKKYYHISKNGNPDILKKIYI